MSSKAAEKVYGRHSGYRKLKAYQVAELLYDFTCRFCDRCLPKSDRHHDQMVQAARSGYQNIAERIEERAANQEVYGLIRDGIPVEFDDARSRR